MPACLYGPSLPSFSCYNQEEEKGQSEETQSLAKPLSFKELYQKSLVTWLTELQVGLVTWPPLVKGGLRDAMFILGILPPLNNRDIPLIRSGECVMGNEVSGRY